MKIFQSQVFEHFLAGTSLQECYEAVGAIANQWWARDKNNYDKNNFNNNNDDDDDEDDEDDLSLLVLLPMMNIKCMIFFP